jgi:peptidoglycan/LPS O-acetylase OafA/YrhL
VNTERADSGNLDLLRSFAVLCVLVFHLLLFFGRGRVAHGAVFLGHWGVLVFFVHTSIVLMASLERQHRSGGGRRAFVEFMVRRGFRLLPLCWLTILAIVALDLPVGHLVRGQFVAVSTAPLDVAQNLLLIQNLGGAESLEAPLWSLPYEMQMYLVLPALFWLMSRTRTSLVMLALWGVVAAAALWRHHEAEVDLLDYAPCFLAGVAGYAIARGRTRGWQLPAVWWPLAIAAATWLYLTRPSLRNGWIACLVVAIGVVFVRELRDGRLRRLVQLIARYSYGVYLAHFALIWLAFERLAGAPWLVRVAVFGATLVALPVALFHGVERPMIGVGDRVARWLRAREPRVAAIAAAPVVAAAAIAPVARALRVDRARAQPPTPGSRRPTGAGRRSSSADRAGRSGPRAPR